jgi:hypothetical protein
MEVRELLALGTGAGKVHGNHKDRDRGCQAYIILKLAGQSRENRYTGHTRSRTDQSSMMLNGVNVL